MFRIDESVAFVWIHDELGGHVLVAERVPELEGLGRRAFTVAITDDNQRG